MNRAVQSQGAEIRHKGKIARILALTGLLATISPIPSYADGRQTTEELLATLRKAEPSATWTPELIERADVNCDGIADIIAIGREGVQGTLLVVIPGTKGKADVDWIIEHSKRRFIRIVLSPHSCEGDGQTLDGCQPSKRCQDFSLADDETDPLNFYWDSKRRSFGQWSF